jgi:hypothetical protein
MKGKNNGIPRILRLHIHRKSRPEFWEVLSAKVAKY